MKSTSSTASKLWFYGAVLAGACFLLLPAFWNGFPLMNSDDGTYLNSGFLLENPGDRPITYGLLLRAFSLNGLSLWIAVFAQAYVLSWLLFRTVKTMVAERFVGVVLCIVFFLSVTTSASWVASEIIPDVCTPMALLSAYLILAANPKNRDRALLFAIYFSAIATHLSHIVIFSGLLVLVLLFKRFFFEKEMRRRIAFSVLYLFLATLATIPIMGKSLSRSKHVFFMAALLDQGILKPYLDEHCAAKNYKLCKYKDNLNTDPNYFLWDEGSPLYQEGGWEATKEEYSTIINGTFTEPKYIGMHIAASINQTGKQAVSFNIGDGNFPFGEGTHVHGAIKTHTPNDEQAYLHSRQHSYNILEQLVLANGIINVVVIVSLVVLIAVGFQFGKRLPKAYWFLVFFMASGIAINIWDCGTFAQVNGRYGCRVMWLIPFCALLCIGQLFSLERRNSIAAKPD